jgi:acyl-CoA thioesterase
VSAPRFPGDLTADTAVAPGDAPGAWRVELPDRWDYLLPSGGVLVTASQRAAAAALADDALRLVSSSTIFCAPVPAGRLDLDVTVLRRGKRAAQVRIVGRGAPASGDGDGAGGDGDDSDGGVAFETLATFARDRDGPDVLGARFPDVPMPDACGPLVDPARPDLDRMPRFFRNFDVRVAAGARFWEKGWQAGPARALRWYRYGVPATTPDGRFDRLAHAPIIDTMPPALTQAVGPGGYRFYAPSLDLTLHVVDDTDREWLLVAAYCRRARAGVAIAEVEVWDDARRLVAYGTQTMYIRTISGAPPPPIVAPP